MESTDIKFKLSQELTESIKDKMEVLDTNLRKKFREKLQNKVLTYEQIRELYQNFCLKNEHIENFKYFHEWVENSEIIYPSIPIPKRSAEYEARIERLKKEQAQRDYNKMTLNVDNKALKETHGPVINEVKLLRSQMFAVMNFILTVGGTFMFGYKAVEYSLNTPIIPAQVMTGMILATIVAVAELYFLAKII